MTTGRTLVVTNDFPPRPGGIQSFVSGLLDQLPPERVVVYASSWRGADSYDRTLAYEVVRDRAGTLLPDPRVARRTADVLRATGCDRVLFGASAPLGLLAPKLRAAGAERLVGLTHGHEAGWAQLPGAKQTLARIVAGLDAMTYLGGYTQGRISAAIRPADRSKLHRLVPGVDAVRFSPDVSGDEIRKRHGIVGQRVIVCVSRLMPRKGQDTLIEALPAIATRVPDVALLLVGGGPLRERLGKRAAALGVADRVVMTGSVPAAELPMHYAAGDMFAMPCRTRGRGLDVEGLGIVYLEASATGLAVVAGDSGGAPDAVQPGVTGEVIASRPEDPGAVVAAVTSLLLDPERAAGLGQAGRDWVMDEWGWARSGARLAALLEGSDPER